MNEKNVLVAAPDRALYFSPVRPVTGWRLIPSPTLTIGLSGRFLMHLADGRVESCNSCLLNAGVPHRLDANGESVVVVFLEPDAQEALHLRTLFQQDGGIVFDPAHRVGARSPMDRYLYSFDFRSLLKVWSAQTKPIDPRIARSLRHLRGSQMWPVRRGEAAAAAYLSESRFNHLFQAQMGISFRRFRLWTQFRAALKATIFGGSLSTSPLHYGFADAAHFSRTYREILGVTPSATLRNTTFISMHDEDAAWQSPRSTYPRILIASERDETAQQAAFDALGPIAA